MFRRIILDLAAAVALAAHLIGAVFLLSSHSAEANDSSACYAIADADSRAMCLAEARKEPSMCYAVQDQALRARCLAEVKR